MPNSSYPNAQNTLYSLHRQHIFEKAYPSMQEIFENIHPSKILKFVEGTGKMDENYTFQELP